MDVKSAEEVLTEEIVKPAVEKPTMEELLTEKPTKVKPQAKRPARVKPQAKRPTVKATPRKPKPTYQVVKPLRISHGNVLLEWESGGLVERCYLPLSMVKNAKVGQYVSVEKGDLAKGAPFGDDLTPYLAVQPPTPAQVQDLLRRRGLWRRGDVLQQSSVVRSALQALYKLDVVRMQGRIKRFLEHEGGT